MNGPEDAIIVRYVPVGGGERRIVFEPRVDGYYRREQTWLYDEGRWHETGCEVIDRVAFENVPASAVD